MSEFSGPDDPSPEGQSSDAPEVVDLGLARIAREIQREFDGLFGINHRDIEKALERLERGEANTQSLPDPVRRVAALLDLVFDQAQDALETQNYTALAAMIEMLDAYRERVRKLVED